MRTGTPDLIPKHQETNVAKGDQKSNREKKKPKSTTAKTPAAASPFPSGKVKPGSGSAKKGR